MGELDEKLDEIKRLNKEVTANYIKVDKLRKEVKDLTKKNKELVGSTQSILVEGLSKKQTRIDKHSMNLDVQWTGRTSTNKIVNFSRGDDALFGDEIATGRMVTVKILKAHSHSLWGEPVDIVPISLGLIGEKSYVA